MNDCDGHCRTPIDVFCKMIDAANVGDDGEALVDMLECHSDAQYIDDLAELTRTVITIKMAFSPGVSF